MLHTHRPINKETWCLMWGLNYWRLRFKLITDLYAFEDQNGQTSMIHVVKGYFLEDASHVPEVSYLDQLNVQKMAKISDFGI